MTDIEFEAIKTVNTNKMRDLAKITDSREAKFALVAMANELDDTRTQRNIERARADRAEAELARVREAGTDALEAGLTLMRILEAGGGAIVPYLMDTDDNPGQWFRYTLVSLATALKETDND